MYTDVTSVRSDPLSPINSRTLNINKPNIYFDEQYGSQSRFQNSPQRWKNMLLPQIDQKYQQIMKQREGFTRRVELENQKSRVSRASVASRGSKLNIRLSNSRAMDIKNLQSAYQQKIESLQQQNQNLRQQLYYLREALLINFQTKQKVKEKQQSNSPKKSQ